MWKLSEGRINLFGRSPCLRRVSDGSNPKARSVPNGSTLLDPGRIGPAVFVSVFVQVVLERPVDDCAGKTFRARDRARPEVWRAVNLMTGDSDYLLRVVDPDLGNPSSGFLLEFI